MRTIKGTEKPCLPTRDYQYLYMLLRTPIDPKTTCENACQIASQKLLNNKEKWKFNDIEYFLILH